MLCLQNGQHLGGNTLAFLQYYRNIKKPSFELIVLSRSANVQHTLTERYPTIRSVYSYSFTGIVAFCQSRVLLISHGAADYLPFTKLRHQHVLNLWHGIPIKTIGGNSQPPQFDAMVVSSLFEAELMKKAFNLTNKQLLVFGMSRMDALFNAPSVDSPAQKQILYVPTFRDNDQVKWFPFDDVDLDKLNQFCLSKQIQIIIKPHINDLPHVQTLHFEQYKSISVVTDAAADLQQMLRQCWCVLTDYSGVYFDAVAIDKPIIFVPYDFEAYAATRGFMYNYDAHTPGPKVKTQQQLIAQLDLLLNENDSFTSARKEIRDKFFEHKDGKASERLATHITRLAQGQFQVWVA